MTKLARMVVLAVALVVIFGGALGGSRSVEAANGYEQWVGPFDDSCYYYWNGYAYVVRACPQSGAWVDFYVDGGNGQWTYMLSVGSLSDGGTWTYYGGIYYYNTVSNGYVNGLYATSGTIGAPTWEGLTSNVFVSDLTMNHNNALIDNINAPYCIEIVGNVCYY